MRTRDAWHAGDFWRPYFLYVGLSALYALFAAGIVAFWAPEAAGSGMPEIKVSLLWAVQQPGRRQQPIGIQMHMSGEGLQPHLHLVVGGWAQEGDVKSR